MKKLISLLLAVSVMVASTCVSAESLVAGGQRNPGGWADSAGNRNSDTIRSYYRADQMAVYRPGDTISFTINQVGIDAIDAKDGTVTIDRSFNVGDVITFISYEKGADTLDSSTVMFIDQVVANNTSVTYNYKIREGLAEGGYKIDIKIGDYDVMPFYYAVADPKVNVLYVDEAETKQYIEKDGVAYYFAELTIGGGSLLEQADVTQFGFDTKNLSDSTYGAEKVAELDAMDSIEAEGVISWLFAIPVEIGEGTLTNNAEGYLNN